MQSLAFLIFFGYNDDMNKFIRATVTPPEVWIRVDLDGDDLVRARIVEKARDELLYKMRQALEKQMVELTKDKLVFRLIQEDE